MASIISKRLNDILRKKKRTSEGTLVPVTMVTINHDYEYLMISIVTSPFKKKEGNVLRDKI